ncbi:hypothetical protein [uncultured Granulicatella sp.]|uniref:hypothetical protein n=1 Tax=uncultured Granulicatella sp. TaxID=316089 RepID=UPI0028EB933F|nr:hypothetical protein [uncultured Granulicatella sp.]
MLKRIIASASLLLYLLLPFFNIQIMNIFYPNFLRANHTALFGITILFILNIVLTILVITLSIKTNLLKSRMITVGIYLFMGLLLLVLIIGIPKVIQTYIFTQLITSLFSFAFVFGVVISLTVLSKF